VRPIHFSVVLLAVGLASSPNSVAQTPAPSSSGCLHYEPHVVRLVGRLITEPHYGPPNFGETPDEDEKLDIPVLQLAHAVDVCGESASEIDQDTVRNVENVQIVASRIKLKAFAGQDVTVTGRLYEALAANHYTKVLIFADSIRVNERGIRRL
jgi:uncharacterized protein DUF4431